MTSEFDSRAFYVKMRRSVRRWLWFSYVMLVVYVLDVLYAAYLAATKGLWGHALLFAVLTLAATGIGVVAGVRLKRSSRDE